MIESVKYTLESTIDNSERELFQIDEDLERMERELNELSIYRFNLVKRYRRTQTSVTRTLF